MPMPEVFAPKSPGPAPLNYLPQPAGAIAGSPITVNTASINVGPFEEGVLMMTVDTNAIHIRLHKAGETPVAATLGEVLLPTSGNVGPHVMPVSAGDVMTTRSVTIGAGTLRVSYGRKD